MRTFPLTIAICLAASATAFAAPPVKEVDSAKGKVLAAENGMTLYTYKDDHGGASTCYDACATNWPPFIAEASAKAEGAYKGRKRQIAPADVKALRAQGLGASAIARQLGCSRKTIYRALVEA